MFEITVRPARNFVEAQIAGFLSTAEVATYSAELNAHFAAGRLKPGYLMLIDVSEAVIQAQDVIAAFQAHVAVMPRAARLVVVTGTSPIRIQIRRVLQENSTAVVATRNEAMTVLLQPVRAVA